MGKMMVNDRVVASIFENYVESYAYFKMGEFHNKSCFK